MSQDWEANRHESPTDDILVLHNDDALSSSWTQSPARLAQVIGSTGDKGRLKKTSQEMQMRPAAITPRSPIGWADFPIRLFTRLQGRGSRIGPAFNNAVARNDPMNQNTQTLP